MSAEFEQRYKPLGEKFLHGKITYEKMVKEREKIRQDILQTYGSEEMST